MKNKKRWEISWCKADYVLDEKYNHDLSSFNKALVIEKHGSSHILEDGKSHELDKDNKIGRTHHFQFCRACGLIIEGKTTEGED